MRSFLYRMMMVAIGLLIVCGVIFALLPTFISTDWGRQQVVEWINHSIPGQVEIRSLTLHWGKGQEVEGFLLKDPEGKSVVGIENFSTEATLWQILRKSTHWGFTRIQELNAAIITDEKGWTNLQRALGVTASADIPPQVPSTITLSDVNANFYLFADHQPLSGSIKGVTQQDHLMGSFEAHVALTGLQASNWDKLKEDAQNYLSIEGSKEAKVQARVVNFPVDLIDRLVALRKPELNGLFHSLLGDRLNVTLDKEPSPEGLAFNLAIQAPLMQGDVKGKVVKQLFSLQEPAAFHFNLTPQSVNPFTQPRFELLRLSRLEFVLQELVFPLTFLTQESSADPCLVGFKARASLPHTSLDTSLVGELDILSLQASFESPLCDHNIRVQVLGQAQHTQDNQDPFNIHLETTLNKPDHFSRMLKQICKGMQSSLKISHLPLEMIPLFKQQPEWIEQIGSAADVQLDMSKKEREEWDLTLSLQTPHLVLSQAQFNLGKDLTLTSPTSLHWQMSAHCLATFLKSERFSLEQSCPVEMTVKRLQIPLDHHQIPTRFQLESVIPELRLSELTSMGIVQVKHLTLKVDSHNLTDFSSQLNAQVALLTAEGLYSSWFNHPLDLTQTATWKITPSHQIEAPFVKLQLNSATVKGFVEGYLTADRHFTLTQPAHFQYTLTPPVLQAWSHLIAKEWPQLQQPAHAELSIEPTTLDLSSTSLAKTRIKGSLAIDQLSLQNASGVLPTLEDLLFPWTMDGPMNAFSANFRGLASTEGSVKPSQLTARIQIEQWLNQGDYDPSKAQIEVHADLTSLPTSVVSVLLTTHDLSPLLGPVMDVDLKTLIDRAQETPGYWDMNLDSETFHTKARFKLNHTISLYDSFKPAEFRWTITPEGYAYLRKWIPSFPDGTLAAPTTLSGSLSQFNLPITEIYSWPNQGQIDASFMATDIQWKGQAIPPVTLEGQIKSQNLTQQLSFLFKILSSSLEPLTVEGALTHLFTPQGQWNQWQEMGVEAHVQGQRLTPAFVRALFLLNAEAQQKLRALFGDAIDVKARGQWQRLSGPIQAEIKGAQGAIYLDGQLKEGLLTLNSPLEGSVYMTPLFTQAFFARNVPVLSSAIGAEQPLKLTIEPAQFACPLFPFKLDQVRIGKGIVDLGKVRFRNEGDLRAVLNLIKPISDPQVTIWFTPLYFQLNQGQLTVKRLDLLVAQTYTLASWGMVDLMTHQANLTLGLTPQTLQYAFGIKGLSDQYLLQIPLRSSQGQMEIDKPRVAGRISALIAQTRGGSKGKFLGDLIDMAMTDPDSPQAPAPTTQPFPWAKELNSSATPQEGSSLESDSSFDGPSRPQKESKEEKKAKKKKHKNLKDLDPEGAIKQGASQVLDRLLGQ